MPLVSSVDSVPFEPARGSTPGGVCDSTVAGCSKAVEGTSGTPGESLSATFASTELLIAAPHAPTSKAIGINAPAFCQRLSRCALPALIAGHPPRLRRRRPHRRQQYKCLNHAKVPHQIGRASCRERV